MASDGGIFSFGDAPFYGSTGAIALNKPIVGMAPPPTARATGWSPPTAASSPSATPLLRLDRVMTSTSPSWAWRATPDGKGYWLVAADGGVFAFGDAGFYGSRPAARPRPGREGRLAPVGQGYWIEDQNGTAYPFGDAAGAPPTEGCSSTR